MIWRMNALRARMGTIGAQIADIQTHLNANQQAHLKRGLDFLEHHKRTGSDKDLHTALAERNFATHLYRHFVQVESGGRKRLLTLNLCGRYYMLSLTAQARCLLAGGGAVQAEKLLRGEQATLTTLARVTFEEVIGVTPEVYLDPGFQEHGVTLELLADVYLRAARMGGVPESNVGDAWELFERLRSKVYGAKGWFRARSKTRAALLARFKYLLACLEDVERIESLRLRIAAGSEGRGSFADLQRIAAEAGRAYSNSAGAVYGVAYA